LLELGSPALDTALQMGPHWGRAEGKENLPDLLATLLLMHPRRDVFTREVGCPGQQLFPAWDP